MSSYWELKELRELNTVESYKTDLQIHWWLLLTVSITIFVFCVFFMKKRINRVNYVIYYTSVFTLFILCIIWIWKIDKYGLVNEINIYTLLWFSTFILFSISLLLLKVKRWHDFWKDTISTLAQSIIPFYPLYLALKKWDASKNKYWNIDEKIMFLKKSSKKRKNIFETIFYNPIFWPYLKEEKKDEIVKKSSWRLLIVLYSMLFPTGIAVITLIAWDLNDEELSIYILVFTLAYKFFLKIYFHIEQYIKSNI